MDSTPIISQPDKVSEKMKKRGDTTDKIAVHIPSLKMTVYVRPDADIEKIKEKYLLTSVTFNKKVKIKEENENKSRHKKFDEISNIISKENDNDIEEDFDEDLMEDES